METVDFRWPHLIFILLGLRLSGTLWELWYSSPSWKKDIIRQIYGKRLYNMLFLSVWSCLPCMSACLREEEGCWLALVVKLNEVWWGPNWMVLHYRYPYRKVQFSFVFLLSIAGGNGRQLLLYRVTIYSWVKVCFVCRVLCLCVISWLFWENWFAFFAFLKRILIIFLFILLSRIIFLENLILVRRIFRRAMFSYLLIT